TLGLDGGDDLAELVHAAAGDSDVGALPRELEREGAAEAGAAAGNPYCGILEALLHGAEATRGYVRLACAFESARANFGLKTTLLVGARERRGCLLPG